MAEALMSLGEALRRLAASQGEAPAVTCEGRTLTYAEFNARTNRIARAMAAKGVKLGDLVTIGLPNSIGFVEACFAAWKLGATPSRFRSACPRPRSRPSATWPTRRWWWRWTAWRPTARGSTSTPSWPCPTTTANCPTLSPRS